MSEIDKATKVGTGASLTGAGGATIGFLIGGPVGAAVLGAIGAAAGGYFAAKDIIDDDD